MNKVVISVEHPAVWGVLLADAHLDNRLSLIESHFVVLTLGGASRLRSAIAKAEGDAAEKTPLFASTPEANLGDCRALFGEQGEGGTGGGGTNERRADAD